MSRLAAYDPTDRDGGRWMHVLGDKPNRTACDAPAVTYAGLPTVERIAAELSHKLCPVCDQRTATTERIPA